MPAAFHLALAIVAEVVGTTALKASDGLTRPAMTALVAVAYGAAFYFLSLTLRTMPMGTAYAIWSGVGMALIALSGWVFFRQALQWTDVAGIALIMAGVALLNLSTRAAPPG